MIDKKAPACQLGWGQWDVETAPEESDLPHPLRDPAAAFFRAFHQRQKLIQWASPTTEILVPRAMERPVRRHRRSPS